jgi:hypothetical protein
LFLITVDVLEGSINKIDELETGESSEKGMSGGR